MSVDFKDLESLTKQMLDQQKYVVSNSIHSLNNDETVSKEDKDFINGINSQVNEAMKNGDAEGLKTLMNILQNKLTK